jgi:hypothetical protein
MVSSSFSRKTYRHFFRRFPPDAFPAIALSLRDRIDLGPTQRFRLVGVGLSNFRDLEQLQSPLFD